MTRDEVRRAVLETLIELAVQPKAGRENRCVGLDAHALLTGKPFKERAWQNEQLKAAYPQFVPGPTADERELAEASAGKAAPICIWHRGDALAYYAATEQNRADWNGYAQGAADAASEDLDMGEALSAYTSVDRDGQLHSWAPPLWFPEWLKQRSR